MKRELHVVVLAAEAAEAESLAWMLRLRISTVETWVNPDQLLQPRLVVVCASAEEFPGWAERMVAPWLHGDASLPVLYAAPGADMGDVIEQVRNLVARKNGPKKPGPRAVVALEAAPVRPVEPLPVAPAVTAQVQRLVQKRQESRQRIARMMQLAARNQTRHLA